MFEERSDGLEMRIFRSFIGYNSSYVELVSTLSLLRISN